MLFRHVVKACKCWFEKLKWSMFVENNNVRENGLKFEIQNVAWKNPGSQNSICVQSNYYVTNQSLYICFAFALLIHVRFLQNSFQHTYFGRICTFLYMFQLFSALRFDILNSNLKTLHSVKPLTAFEYSTSYSTLVGVYISHSFGQKEVWVAKKQRCDL